MSPAIIGDCICFPSCHQGLLLHSALPMQTRVTSQVSLLLLPWCASMTASSVTRELATRVNVRLIVAVFGPAGVPEVPVWLPIPRPAKRAGWGMHATAAVQLCKRRLLWKLLSLTSSHNLIWGLQTYMESVSRV